jgi:hypothetical protein
MIKNVFSVSSPKNFLGFLGMPHQPSFHFFFCEKKTTPQKKVDERVKKEEKKNNIYCETGGRTNIRCPSGNGTHHWA